MLWAVSRQRRTGVKMLTFVPMSGTRLRRVLAMLLLGVLSVAVIRATGCMRAWLSMIVTMPPKVLMCLMPHALFAMLCRPSVRNKHHFA